tara:strand:- start:372 stop:692 length:321 start_codon:yes stop_codon:yes gene_type:complete
MDNLLLEICGKELFFDIDKLSDICKIEDIEEDNEQPKDVEKLPIMENMGMQIDVTKYEMYREMIGTLLMYQEQIDNKMGMVGLNSTTVPFKLAYNTLLMKGILKEL